MVGETGRSFRLSPAQLGLWHAQQLAGDVPITISQYVEIRGDFDADLLAAVGPIAGAEFGTATLRIIEEAGEPRQIFDPTLDMTVSQHDLRAAADPEKAAQAWLRDAAAAPLDLLTDRLGSVAILRLADDHYYWFARIHHIGIDGLGAMNLMHRVAELYTAAKTGSPAPPSRALPLSAITESEHKYRISDRFLKDQQYWIGQTAGFPSPPSLSRRPPAGLSAESLVCTDALSAAASELFDQVAKRSSAAPLAVAGFAAYLARMTASDDIVLGLPVTARNSIALRNSGGMMSNIVPLRLHVTESTTVAELITAAQTALVGALRHQRYRHEDIRNDSGYPPAERGFFGPVVNIMLFHSEIRLGDVIGEFHVLSTGPVEDFAVNLYPSVAGQRTHIDFEANPHRYDVDELTEHHSRFVRFFEQFMSADETVRVADLDLIDEIESARLAPRLGRPGGSTLTLPELFAAAAAEHADSIAVTSAGTSLTYRELDDRSNRLAAFLVERGVRPETYVAIALRRSIESIVAIWAVAKSGGAFVPVDPDYPSQRVAHMLDDSGAIIGISTAADHDLLPATLDWLVIDDGEGSGEPSAVSVDIRMDAVAYLIFTSGSTGRPKGVAVTHSGLHNFAIEQRERYATSSESRVLHVSSPSFDASVFEYLLAFGAGATLVIAPPGVFGGHELHAVITEHQVTHSFMTPSALASVDPTGLDCLTHLLVGGETVPTHLIDRWAGGRRFFNAYGPTETTIMSAISDAVAPGDGAAIGGPIGGTGMVVLDSRLRPVPVGAVGEVFISGAGLARGYHRRAGLTAARFVANPWGAPGERMYRTGDAVSWTRGAESFEFIGRTDSQVKVRGFRIELGEIDAALVTHPTIGFAATVLHTPTRGAAGLVSYVVAADRCTVDVGELGAHIAGSLAPHMVPAHIIEIEKIPLTPVGKLDRKALPEPVFTTDAPYRAPRTVTERLIADTMADIVGASAVGIDDDFFELGGNSLTATQLAARASAALSADVVVRDVFEAPTVAGLASRVDAQLALGGSSARRLAVGPRPSVVPLSPAQRRLWFLNRLDPSSAAANIPFAVRLTGALDVSALATAMRDVVARHESLRTLYPDSDAGPHQVVVDDIDLALPVVTASGAAELSVILLEFASRGFDLVHEVPVRALLVASGPDENVLAIVVHHVSADGWSMGPLAKDVVAAYVARCAGVEPVWAPLPVQYADYSLWHHDLLGSDEDVDSLAGSQLEYWKATLAGLPDSIELPTDRPRPPVASYRGASIEFDIDPHTHQLIKVLAQQHESTVFMVMHAALAVLLNRLGAGRDIAVGTPVAGRGQRELDDLVGMFVNTLVLRTQVDPGELFATLLSTCREVALGAFGHNDIPFERLVEVLNPARSTAHHPLFQVMLAAANVDTTAVELPGLSAQTEEIDTGLALFDLRVTVTERPEVGGISVVFNYATDLFDEPTVRGFVRRFGLILDSVVQQPLTPIGDIAVLESEEPSALVGAAVEVPGLTILDLFDEQVRRSPDAVAIVAEDATLTYAEFDSRANQLARLLIANSIGPESTVAVAMDRSVELLVAIYAVVKAGAAYVPIDPDQPVERTRYVLESATCACVLTTAGRFAVDGYVSLEVDTLDLSQVDPTPVRDVDRVARLHASNAAYVIFTSGSTGRPKGVEVSHRAAVNLLGWMQTDLPITAADRVLLKAPVTFDVSVWEVFAVLGVGGRLVVLRPDGHLDAAHVIDVIDRERVTIAEFVPSMLDIVLTTPELTLPDSLSMIYVGGEAISPTTARGVTERGLRLGNFYGPTEVTVTATYFEIAADTTYATIPIGGPVWNTDAYVLDERLHPVPVGVAGELYLAGEQLARGYKGRPGITADRFVADPAGPAGERMYRTGDLVRRNRDGALEYLGRTDFQVKLRGLRIELGEIEAALLDQYEIGQAVALVREDAPGQARLVAYVTRAGDDIVVDVGVLRQRLTARLPSYMVPPDIVVLEQFPLGATGKLDRKALPVPHYSAPEYRAPTNAVEEAVVATLAEVLGRDRVGLDDDFFAIGGNSLIATRVASRIGAALDIDVPLRLLFESPTPGELALRLADVAKSGRKRPVLGPRVRPDRVPLSPAQQRIWFLNRYDPESPAYNLPFAVRFVGELDVAALRAGLADVAARHESLRTTYPETAQGPYQLIHPADGTVADLVVRPVTAGELPSRLTEFAMRGFDVTTDMPLRLALFRLDSNEHVLAVVLHHIASDGGSIPPMAIDVMRAFSARASQQAPQWDPIPLQYADYTLWQLELLGSEDEAGSAMAEQLAYWRRTLAGLPDRTALPTDRPRPAEPSHRGGTVDFAISAELHRGMRDLARDNNASVFMVAHALLAVLLRRFSDSDDIVIGTAVDGRGDPALDRLIGMFVNTLVLRTEIGLAAGFSEIMARTRDVDLAALANSAVPFEKLVDVLGMPRDRGRHALFQVALLLDEAALTEFDLPGLRTQIELIDPHVAKFDLQLTLVPQRTGNGYRGVFTYATDLFDESTVQSFAAMFVRILAAVVAEPTVPVGDIDILETADRMALAPVRGAPCLDERTLPEVFTAAANRDPDAIALWADGVETTYRELDERSNRLARWLIGLGVGSDMCVALGLGRSVEFVVAMWAVTKTGAAFLPVDTRLPQERIVRILADSAAAFGLTEVGADLPSTVHWSTFDEAGNASSSESAAPLTDSERRAPVLPGNLAYVIFTSGSTGLPKGVGVTHRGLANLVDEQRTRFAVTSDSRVLHAASPSFDATVFENLMAFGVGATVVLAPQDVIGGAQLGSLLVDAAVTHVVVTPAVLGSVDHRGIDTVTTVIVAGDVCPPELVARWAPGRHMFNGYGPTETTVWATCTDPLVAGAPVSIGRPVRGFGVAVLDSRLHPVPVGVVGELYLAGPALARGYLSRAALSAERFVASSLGDPGDRMYRTGDMVRWSASGELQFVGRRDFQVKVRGLRIELGEIDAALCAHPGVEFAVTVGHEVAGQTVLVSYIRPFPGATVDPGAALEELRRVLPSYMVPVQIIPIADVPLTATGKLDRKALPEPIFGSATHSFRLPTTDAEIVVAGVFGDVTGAERVGLDDSFFALGGNSLSATQVVARVGAELGRHVSVRVLFDAPTVEAFAVAVHEVARTDRPRLVAGERPAEISLSPAQQRIWFLGRLDPTSGANNLPLALRLTGALDVAALQAAFADVVDRHESLRTVYPESGHGPHQVIRPAADVVPTLTPITADEARIRRATAELAMAGFDLTEQVPLRAALFQVAGSPDEHVLVIVVHHICADGWSLAPLATDVMASYFARSAGTAPTWQPLPVQYADYSLWQRRILGREDDPESLAAEQIAYWTKQLADLPDQLDLPTDRSRPALQSYAGATVNFAIDADRHNSLLALASQHNSSLFMVLHSALAVLLSRLTASTDVAIGAPVAGRGEPELDQLIGMFVNTLVLRTTLDPAAGFAATLDHARDVDLAAFGHSDIPFERLVEVLNPTRSTARHPLFQVALTLQNLPVVAGELHGLAVAPIEFELPVAKFDLHLTVSSRFDEDGNPGLLDASFTYATDLFDESTVRRFADMYARILDQVGTDAATPIGDLELISDDERSHILLDRNATDHAVPVATLVDLFDEQVSAAPDSVALVCGSTSLTYGEFDARVNRLARQLIGSGAGPGELVGIAIGRSVELLVAVYAVIKTGAAYVPIDEDQPHERTALLLESAEPIVVLHASDVVGLDSYASSPITDADRRSPLRPGNAAYVLFTSGSTGRPKGVTVSHSAVVNRLAWMQHEYPIDRDDAVLFKTPATFDVSVWELFWPLHTGARLVIAAPDGHRDPAYLVRLIVDERVSVAHFVPSMLGAFLAEPAVLDCVSLRHVVASGEALPTHTADVFGAVLPNAALHNLYGPTEAAIDVTYFEPNGTGRSSVPIGVPVWNTQVFVLDQRLRPVPIGVPGELYLAGAQLAQGYVGRPDLTADRFVASPFHVGERMYRTGDLAFWTANGVLEYVGRTDFQVKLRGQRVELGEVESAMSRFAGVVRAVAVVRDDPRLGQQLVGYVGGTDIDKDAVTVWLRSVLPSYMVPSTVVVLDELPVSSTGKLDRKALPEPYFAAAIHRGARTPLEHAVASAFGVLLGVESVGLDDNFFALGGNSLLATRLVAQLRDDAGIDVPLLWLFTDPTPASIARRISEADQTGRDSSLDVVLPMRVGASAAGPLFCIHPVVGLSWCYTGLIPHLNHDRPIYGLQSPSVTEDVVSAPTIDESADRYVREILSIQPAGPYRLLGWSLGGVIAHAIAVRLQVLGHQVAFLGLLDSGFGVELDDMSAAAPAPTDLLGGLGIELDGLEIDTAELQPETAAAFLAQLPGPFAALTAERIERMLRTAIGTSDVLRRHQPTVFEGDLVFFTAVEDDPTGTRLADLWRPFVSGDVRNHAVEATHWRMTTVAALATIGPIVDASLEPSSTSSPGNIGSKVGTNLASR